MAETTDPFTATPDPKPAPAPAPVEAPALTPYVVLKKEDSGGGWLVAKERVTCRNAEVAIREVAEKLGADEQAGTYLAIPVRSWNPVKVAPKTVTTLEMEAAS